MRRILEKIYEDILEFHKRALHFFSSRSSFFLPFILKMYADVFLDWKNFFKASWNNFGHRFKFLIDNLERYKNLVESRASLLEYESAKEARLLAETKYTQFEEGERKRQLRMIAEWLSPADFKADQETAKDARADSKNSGRWLFKDKKVSALCDPHNTTVLSLWLDGIPGAGRANLLPYPAACLISVKARQSSHPLSLKKSTRSGLSYQRTSSASTKILAETTSKLYYEACLYNCSSRILICSLICTRSVSPAERSF